MASKKNLVSAAGAAIAIFLAACGGGGSPTPTPTPAPTPTPTPTPNPTPNATSCPATDGIAADGFDLFDSLSFFGSLNYLISNTTANAAVTVQTTSSISLSASSSLADTGSVRLDIWAVSSSFSGGIISGTRIARLIPNFAGNSPSDFVYRGQQFSASVSGTGQNPPPGRYCIVMVLNRFSQCSGSIDGFCFTDFHQFSSTGVQFF